MMNKLGLIIISVICALIQTGCAEQSTWMSLNSSNPRIIWEVKPQADLENITGEQISTPEFKMSDYVKGVVPGTVFTAYVEAGIVPDPNYADNIYKVDETFYNRPFWYRTEFELPSSYSGGGVCGFISTIQIVLPISILTERRYRGRKHLPKM